MQQFVGERYYALIADLTYGAGTGQANARPRSRRNISGCYLGDLGSTQRSPNQSRAGICGLLDAIIVKPKCDAWGSRARS